MGIFSFLEPDRPTGTFNQQNKLARKATDKLEHGLGDAQNATDQYYGLAKPQFQSAVDVFNPIMQQRQAATDMYQNSLGLNGQAGYDAALGAYHQGPGYQFALDQANQNVLRNGAATGGVANGNVLSALSDRAQQLQNLDFGGWQDRLKGQDVLPVAQNKATALQGLGNLFARQGDAKANIYGQFVPQIAGQMNNQASLLGQQASMDMARQQQGIGNAIGIAGALSGFFGA